MSEFNAVITADYVDSTDLDAATRSTLADGLRGAYAQLQGEQPDALPHPISIFGGDSWQVYVAEPAVALWVGLTLRAWGRFELDLDTRLAIAVDTVDFIVGDNLGESDGPAFRRSGRALRDMLRTDRLDLVAPAPESFGEAFAGNELATLGLRSVENALFAIALLADRIAQGWTDAQAQAVYRSLMDETLTTQAIGDQWIPKGISKQAVSQHLDRAGWHDLSDRALHLYEKAVGNLLALAHWAERGSTDTNTTKEENE